MGTVEHDLSKFDLAMSRDFARDDYAVENRGRFMTEAIDEETKEEFVENLSIAVDHLIGEPNATKDKFIMAYLSKDDAELGRLIRLLVYPAIEESAVMRAENMAAEEFDEKY